MSPGGAAQTRRAGSGLKWMVANALGDSFWASARALLRMWQNPKERRAPYPIGYKLAAWRRGFSAESAHLFDFPRDDWRDYVSDYQRKYRCSQLNPYNELFRHKLLWRAFLLRTGFRQAETMATLSRGHVLAYPLDAERSRYVSPEELERLLVEDGGQFVVKPENGERGQGIFLLTVQNGALVSTRGRETRPYHITDSGGMTIIERAIAQHEFWRNFFPDSANTIRALTMWTPGDDAPFLARAVQRIGTADTMPTDNFSGGGVCVQVDIATGRLGAGRMHPAGGRPADERIVRHPVSGAQIDGAVLPHWDRLRETVLRAAASLPVNRYIGWDVMLDETGTPVIIEANGNDGLHAVQAQSGLLTDPAIRRFYAKCGVI